MTDEVKNNIIEAVTKQLADEGKLVEAGWTSLRLTALPDASPVQLKEMRTAFYAGAQHVFGSLMNMLEEGAEATEADLNRISLMNAELGEFIKDFEQTHSRTQQPPEQPPEPVQESERLGDAPIEQEYHVKMQAVAATLDTFFNGEGVHGADRKTGFVLLVFPFGDTESGRVNFISNGANRKDVVALMKEMIARFEGQPEMTGHA